MTSATWGSNGTLLFTTVKEEQGIEGKALPASPRVLLVEDSDGNEFGTDWDNLRPSLEEFASSWLNRKILNGSVGSLAPENSANRWTSARPPVGEPFPEGQWTLVPTTVVKLRTGPMCFCLPFRGRSPSRLTLFAHVAIQPSWEFLVVWLVVTGQNRVFQDAIILQNSARFLVHC